MSCNFWDKASSLLMRLSMALLALGREQEMKSVQADVKLYSFANVTHTKERMENQELINDDNSMEVPRLVLFSDKP